MEQTFPFESQVSIDQRKRLMQQEPRLVWFTGLSGSGKTTLAMHLEHYLFLQGYKAFLLDGDNVRNSLNRDLGFSEKDRHENIRRIGEVAKLMLDAGLVVLCAFISPYEAERALVKRLVGEKRFTEVFVDCPLEICEERDTKGLYAKARQGDILEFTGISAPYETPLSPDIIVKTNTESVDGSMQKIINTIKPLLMPQVEPSAIASI